MHKGFHIHVDACEMTSEFAAALESMGFGKAPFIPVPGRSFAPEFHFTKKINEHSGYRFGDQEPAFKKAYRALEAFWDSHRDGAKGFIEGECIAHDDRVDPTPSNRAIEIPFRVETRKVEEGGFRESEIHITMNGAESDEVLKQKLEQMGFFRAANLKRYGVAHIFTLQGTRSQIEELWKPINDFLRSHGGAKDCKIKEERIANYWISDGSVELPPVIARIDPPMPR